MMAETRILSHAQQETDLEGWRPRSAVIVKGNDVSRGCISVGHTQIMNLRMAEKKIIDSPVDARTYCALRFALCALRDTQCES